MDPGVEPTVPTGPGTSRRRVLIGVYVLLFALALAYFGYRGPRRCLVRVCPDLPVFYAAGAAWWAGEDPYDMPVLVRTFREHGGPPDGYVQMLINPPCSLPWFALLSVFSYPVANVLVLIGNVVLAAVIVWLLYRLFPGQVPTGWAGAAFVLLVVAWAPLHTTISQGQHALTAMTLLLCGVWLMRQRHQYAAGAVFAAAATFRPTFFIVLALWYLISVRRCVRVGISGAVVFALVMLIAVYRFELANVEWREAWPRNVDLFQQDEIGQHSEGTGSFAPDRPERFIMINLQPVLSTWFGRGVVTKYLPWLIVVMVAVVAWRWHRRRAGPAATEQLELVDLALISTLTLLPIYNRFYSAVLLLIPLAWALGAWNDSRCRWPARGVTVLLMVFLVPGVATLLRLMPPGALRTWWSNSVLLPHQTYCILLVTLLLLVAARRVTRCVVAERETVGVMHRASSPEPGL